jgi:hypothetical protein
MKIKLLPILIVTMLIFSACSPITPAPTQALPPTKLPQPTKFPQPTAIPLPTETIAIPFFSPQFQIPIQLTDGKYSDPVNKRNVSIVLQPQMVFGDLNADGIDDAAVLLAEDAGGSGVFVSLVVITSNNGAFNQSNGVLIDDRPILQTLQIVDEKVVVNALIHGVNDPMVNPTFGVTETYRLVEGHLIRVRLTSKIPNGTERYITIDSPVNGSEIGDSVKITGSMPIGPFENNLALRVFDLTGKELYSSGFMVNAADMGAPATFDNLVKLPALPSGSIVQLELVELSMADGSPMTIDSVVVRIK